MDEKLTIQQRVARKAEAQKAWKSEAIEKAIDVLLGATHRDKDFQLKNLLLHLKMMPTIQNWDLDMPCDELPF
jgi:hypothetical protein